MTSSPLPPYIPFLLTIVKQYSSWHGLNFMLRLRCLTCLHRMQRTKKMRRSPQDLNWRGKEEVIHSHEDERQTRHLIFWVVVRYEQRSGA